MTEEMFDRPRPPRGRLEWINFESVHGLQMPERVNASDGRRPSERAWVCVRTDNKADAMQILAGQGFGAIKERGLRRSWIVPEAPPPLRIPSTAVLFWYASGSRRSPVYVLTDPDVDRFPPVAVACWAWNGVTDSGAEDIVTFDEITSWSAAIRRPDLVADPPSS